MLQHLLDVFELLEDVAERLRLFQQCLSRVLVRQDALEVHVIPHEVIIPPDGEATDGAEPAPKVPGRVHRANRKPWALASARMPVRLLRGQYPPVQLF